jgi:penicillin-binding protein 1C
MHTLLFIVLFSVFCAPAFGMPSYDAVKTGHRPSDAVLLDRHGEVIHELRVDPHGRRLEWTVLGNVSPALVRAVVRSEDKRFYDHHGADWKALSSAAIGNFFGNSRRGASTITMQVASLLREELRPRKGQRSIGQKWGQVKAARKLERSWTKDQILEGYLNLVSFRGELEGIAAASRGIFDKDPSGLDEAESAVLAALIRSPNADPERVGERASMLAKSLGSNVTPDEIKHLAKDRLARSYVVRRRIDRAPFVARLLLVKRAARAVSTLDARIQQNAQDALDQALGALSDQNVKDGAVLVVDNRSGEVLAYVGSSRRLSTASFVDGIRAKRQAGSTLKPFLYGLALERRIITASSQIEDTPLEIPTGRGAYRPDNYDKQFRGPVPARTALASSLNIPAVRMLGLAGADAFVGMLRSFGFSGIKDGDHYGPSLALGTADISLWELVNAYRTLANVGVWRRLRLTPAEKLGKVRRVLSREAAFIVSDILSDREARSSTFSLECPLGTRFWTAVKTGTSKDMRDNWCVGYSERYTVGVWVGNFSGSSMWNVSGVSGAAPIWLEVMNELHRDLPGKEPHAPEGVSRKIIAASEQDTKQEWFIKGTEPAKVRTLDSRKQPKIIYPAPDTIIAVDPDIPQDLQKILYEAAPTDPALQLALDDVVIGPSRVVSGLPAPGVHKLSLRGLDGAVADQITFEVR